MVKAKSGVLKRIRAERAGIVIPLPWSKACRSAEPPLVRESGLARQGVQFGWEGVLLPPCRAFVPGPGGGKGWVRGLGSGADPSGPAPPPGAVRAVRV